MILPSRLIIILLKHNLCKPGFNFDYRNSCLFYFISFLTLFHEFSYAGCFYLKVILYLDLEYGLSYLKFYFLLHQSEILFLILFVIVFFLFLILVMANLDFDTVQKFSLQYYFLLYDFKLSIWKINTLKYMKI